MAKHRNVTYDHGTGQVDIVIVSNTMLYTVNRLLKILISVVFTYRIGIRIGYL